jgi:hypothetical protein
MPLLHVLLSEQNDAVYIAVLRRPEI